MDHRGLRPVAPGVFVATASLWRTTSTVVVRGDEALVVDPAMTVAEVEGLAATIGARGWTVGAGFSTHPHWDHLLWSRALGDVPRWSTPVGARVAVERRDRAVQECESHAPGHDAAYLTATRPLPRDGVLPWVDPLPVIEYPAHAHGSAALVVGDVLIVGDMLSDTEVPLLGVGPGAVADYRRGLAVLGRAVSAHGIRVVVPGHGAPAVGAGEIAARFEADGAYLDALLARAAQGPDPADGAIDPRIVDYVASWHAGQLAALRDQSIS